VLLSCTLTAVESVDIVSFESVAADSRESEELLSGVLAAVESVDE
jgi:hypothetical protein